jgi:hypothetical protein
LRGPIDQLAVDRADSRWKTGEGEVDAGEDEEGNGNSNREIQKVTEGNAVGFWMLAEIPFHPHDLDPTRRTMEHCLRQHGAHAINRLYVKIFQLRD